MFQSIIKYLLSKTELTNLISDRIYPDIIPLESKLPALSMSTIFENEDIVMSGHNCEMISIFQFDSKAINKSEAVEIIETIKSIFRSLKSSQDFNNYKLSLVQIMPKLPSEFSDNTYIERIEIKFFHDYIQN